MAVTKDAQLISRMQFLYTKDLEDLIEQIKTYSGNVDSRGLQRAFDFGIKAHLNQKRDSGEPYFNNGFLPGLDAVALYSIFSTVKPKTYLEIGSGHSTRFVSKAKSINSPETKIISIDPHPRSEIDRLCDKVVRTPLEDCDLSVFDILEDNDILFFDGSHRALQNSDVTVFFLEILPKLKTRPLIHVHDIFWPFDYPDEWGNRMYSEQYLLAILILFAADKIDLIFPCTYVSCSTEISAPFNPVFEKLGLTNGETRGSSFWFKFK